jgi:uncharacterized protein YciI
MPKMYFALKMIAPRASFMLDMTEAEKNIMQQHVLYWRQLMAQGYILVYGPVLDPKGVYGLGIAAVDDEEQVRQLMEKDPANGLNTYEWHPMRAVVPEK